MSESKLNNNTNQNSDIIPIDKDHANSQQQVTVQETAHVESQSAKEGGFLASVTSFAPMLIIFVVFYFFVIRPQDKKRKKQESMVDTLKKGEEIVTHSGMYGFVSKVSDNNIVELEVCNGVTIRILKHAIADIVSRKTEPKATKKND